MNDRAFFSEDGRQAPDSKGLIAGLSEAHQMLESISISAFMGERGVTASRAVFFCGKNNKKPRWFSPSGAFALFW